MNKKINKTCSYLLPSCCTYNIAYQRPQVIIKIIIYIYLSPQAIQTLEMSNMNILYIANYENFVRKCKIFFMLLWLFIEKAS